MNPFFGSQASYDFLGRSIKKADVEFIIAGEIDD